MSGDGIATLITSCLAIALSAFNLLLIICLDRKKTRSKYREHFFDKMAHNGTIIDIAKHILNSNVNSSIEHFKKTHELCIEYKEEIKYLMLANPIYYKKLVECIEIIDDSSVLTCQNISDSSDFSNHIKKMRISIENLFEVLEKFYQGK